MEAHTLGELLQSQQNQILSLSIHMDCIVEELIEQNLLDSEKLDKRIKKKLKEIQKVVDKIKENQEIPPMLNFGGPIGEA